MYGCDKCMDGGIAGDVYTNYYFKDCTQPSKNWTVVVAYHVVFLVLSTQVLLTLFIGIIAASMEESQSIYEKDLQLEKDLEDLSKSHKLTIVQINAFREVYKIIDLNSNGCIDEDELFFGLEALGMKISDADLVKMKQKFENPLNELDLVKFIRFMTLTNEFKMHEAANRIFFNRHLKNSLQARKILPHIIFWSLFKRWFSWRSKANYELERKAAIAILGAWRNRKMRQNLVKRAQEMKILK